MTDPTAAIRAIVRDELAALRLPDIGVVTSVFAHEGDDDGHNHECNVQLREGTLELRRVPIATPHIGMVSAPAVGDLVLLAYVNGDPNRAVVVGRLYSEKANPPKHAEKEWRIESPLRGVSSIAIDKDESVVVTAGKTVLTVRKDGAVEIAGEAELKIEVKGAVALKCTDAKIDASGNIDLGDGGAGVITEASHKCYFTGKPLVPSKTVKAKG
ncbi:phage baseplate assembly protein V [Azohydromonas caseinilytica]|uniref:Gp5/Type VI secretion system Vgr protein OB-fold domain-containing protein n=1 Tax=Azohydromonas caseinilytica TaxID=2728836 RepID=A0A848F4N4_9BURK|nr:phage baseplate assembly protein V [Azohydromonas caseinilytica]NML13685.1 hypothetical protein [Azohydromonas caseinilytica]